MKKRDYKRICKIMAETCMFLAFEVKDKDSKKYAKLISLMRQFRKLGDLK